jgi:hypothetical protein
VVIASRFPRALVFGCALAVAACGGEGLTLPPEGEAANITVMSGDEQSGRVGSTLLRPLIVRVTDTRDRPVAGAEVVFTFTDAGGSATPATATTNSDGQASSTLTLGTRVGLVTGTAEVPVDAGVTPVETSFSATAVSDDANGIALISGNDQSAPVNSELPAPLVVQVSDAFGNPIPDVAISWSFEGGGSISEGSTVTGANGQSSVTRRLGPTAGQQTTLASADGLAGSPVTFVHTATAGPASGVVKVSGDDQSALVGTELANPLVVQVLDDQQNPIPNRPVTWVIGDGGGSVNPENTTTDAQGFANTRWTLGPVAGANSVNAVVSGVGQATFSAIGTAGAPSASSSEVSASPTTISAGGGTSTVTVTVRDATSNPVAGASVTITASGSGNSISPASAPTNAAGVATFTFSSTVAEAKIITATAGGVTIEDQATITVQKVASSVEITSDEDDPSTVNEQVTVEFTVTGSGGTPTGEVTITVSGGPETCNESLTSGSGSCTLTLVVPGTGPNNRRVLTASYSGDDRFAPDTDTENHRVNPLPSPNQPPTAAFTPPSCTTGQPCQFTDGSSDSDGNVVSWNWDFGDLSSSPDEDPTHTYGAAGDYQVGLTVTDNDGAQNSVTHTVTVSDAPPPNTAPVANNDTYTVAQGGTLNVGLEDGTLSNDDDAEQDPLDLAAELVQDIPRPGFGDLKDFSSNANGSFSYSPDANAQVGDMITFTYRARDVGGLPSNDATVTITVTAPGP